jgi:hypothetical protein
MQEPCFVKTGTRELTEHVVEMAKLAGFDHPHSSINNSYIAGVCCGPWNTDYPWFGFYFKSFDWNPRVWRATDQPRQHWPEFDASTEEGMAALRAYWFPEEQHDSSPLPHFTMDKEQEKELMLRFNMSEEQWEALPPSAKQALAGAHVEIKQELPFKWIPIGIHTRAMKDTQSVVFSTRGEHAISDVDALALGYFDENEDGTYYPIFRIKPPDFDGSKITHYAQLPTELLPDGEEPHETEDPEWQ